MAVTEKISYVPHALKYRLYNGDSKGNCLLRYDNEAGKADHRHFKGKEKPYNFQNVEKLVADFQNDVERLRGG